MFSFFVGLQFGFGKVWLMSIAESNSRYVVGSYTVPEGFHEVCISELEGSKYPATIYFSCFAYLADVLIEITVIFKYHA